MKKTLLAAIAMTCVAVASAQPKLSADNIDEILKAMTLEEKAKLVVGGRGNSVPGAAGATQAIDRLGIPGTVLADGPAGLRISPTRQGDSQTYYCTGFPVGTVLACTWNTELVEQLTTARRFMSTV